jgi:glutathione S-transferase
MSRYIVYGDSISGNCHKVAWTLRRLGIGHEWREASVPSGDTRREEFLRVNPAGQAPAIVTPEGESLAQSNAILLYLAERHGGGLIPERALPRALMYQWMFREQYSHEPYIAVRRFQKHFLKKEVSQIDPKLRARGEAALALMDARLAESDWFAGDAFSLADIALFAYARLAHEVGFDLARFPCVRSFVARGEATLGLPEA